MPEFAETVRGQRYGRLTAIVRMPSDRWRSVMWKFVCDCRNEKTIAIKHIRSGGTQSCGCLRRENSRRRVTTPGLLGHPLYSTWKGMKQRCCDPRAANYDRYGARGIQVCERWLHSFAEFVADMNVRPTPQHSIDRIDVNGHYEPSNCRWASLTGQRANRRGSA